MLTKMGFASQFISLVMTCVTTITYSVFVNGQPTEYITPERGLRQGDLLSPYLFILCAEGLSAFLRRAHEEGNIKGLSICRGAPILTHLLFADDIILFGVANREEITTICGILKTCELASGQAINLQKSGLTFSKGVPLHDQEEMRQILGIPLVSAHERYLGFPGYLTRSLQSIFSFLIDR